ncbi:MAG: ArnT family glycosyltransferase [Thermoanaerobaculia bacterium]
MGRFRPGPAVLLIASVVLFALAAAFGQSAEFPPPHTPETLSGLLTLFWPRWKTFLVLLPAMLAGACTLAKPLGRKEWLRIGLFSVLAALSELPVLSGVTHHAAYFALGTLATAGAAAALSDRWRSSLSAKIGRIVRALASAPFSGFLLAACAVQLVLTLFISSLAFDRVPHVQDSVAQLFHAKILEQGAVTAPAPPIPEAFEYSHLIISDKWYSIYPPAQSLLLSLLLRLGVPSLTNPLLGVIGLLGIALLARELFSEGVARLAIIVCLGSPYWLLMHSEYMNHALANAALAWGVFAFVRAGRGGRLAWALLSGALFGIAFLVRPFTPVLVGAGLAMFSLMRARREPRWLVTLGVVALAALPGLGLELLFNKATTGQPFLSAYVVKFGRTLPGFHESPWGPPHTPWLGLRNLLADSNGLNRWVPGLLVPWSVFLCGLAIETTEGLTLLFLVPGALAAGHFAYWYVDLCFGPRFLFEAMPCFSILTALSLRTLYRRRPDRVAAFVLVALLGAPFAWSGFLANYAHAFYGVDGAASAQVARAAPPDSIVFVTSDYGGFVWRNDPWLKDGPIFARDLGTKNHVVLERFPDRRPFRQSGDRLLAFEGLPAFR